MSTSVIEDVRLIGSPLYRGFTAILILCTQIFENWVREKNDTILVCGN